MTGRVFICYSKKDADWKARFERFLRTPAENGRIEVFADHQTPPGEDWDATIRGELERAAACVVLVSQDLLNVDYVRNVELPRLIERAETGTLLLTPLFVKPSHADEERFRVHDAESGEDTIALTKYQGLNRPNEPLSGLDDHEVETRLDRAARDLVQRLEAPGATRGRRRRPASRHLTIELERHGDEVLRKFHLPGLHDADRDRVALSPALLGDEGGEAHPELLFDLLLGPQDVWRRVLHRVHASPPHSPIQRGVRVRIRCHDADLGNLPWALARWRDETRPAGTLVPAHELTREGWTFEQVTDDVARGAATFHTPCGFVALCPREGELAERLAVASHVKDLRQLLRSAWALPAAKPDDDPVDRYFHLAHDLEQLREACRARPMVAYVYGPLAQGVLDLGGGRSCSLDDVVRTLGECAPALIVLHTEGDRRSRVSLDGIWALTHFRYGDITRVSRHAVRSWLRGVLSGDGDEESDPVSVFNALDRGARRSGYVLAAYDRWNADRQRSGSLRGRAREALDRSEARAMVVNAVRDLVNKQYRVICLVAHAEDGNLVGHFPEQVLDTLVKEHTELASIRPQHGLRLPSERERRWTEDAVEESFRDALGLQMGDPLVPALAPQAVGRAPGVALLDWGCYGAGDPERPRLTADNLRAWVRFCRHVLGEAISDEGDGLDALCMIAVQTRAEQHGTLQALVGDLAAGMRDSSYGVRLLPVLQQVSAEHIADFLEAPANSSCPGELLSAIPNAIHASTAGVFAATCDLIDELEDSQGWYEFVAAYRPQEQDPVPGDTPL